ncbi:hypothetical protein ACWO80_003459 [Vibrio cholerae]
MKAIAIIPVLALASCANVDNQPKQNELADSDYCYSVYEFASSEVVEDGFLKKWIDPYGFFIETTYRGGTVTAVIDYSQRVSVKSGKDNSYSISKDGKYIFGYQTDNQTGYKSYRVGMIGKPKDYEKKYGCLWYKMSKERFEEINGAYK